MKGHIEISVEVVPSDVPGKNWRLHVETTCTFRPNSLGVSCAVLRACCDALGLDDSSRIAAFSAISAGLLRPDCLEEIVVKMPHKEGAS